MAEVGHEEGSIEPHERELIHSIFTFGETVVREVMVPRPDIIAVDLSRPLRVAEDLMLEHGFSRVPVYRDDLDHCEGFVYAKDILRALHQGQPDLPIARVMRPAHFVPDSKKVAELLREMQRQKFHIAVVTDEYGSVVGLVTLEDVLEELVGEIEDEYDPDEPGLVPLSDGVYRVEGTLTVHDLGEQLGVELPSAEWDTVGGLMTGLLGRIPKEGDEVRFENLLFRADKVQRRRVTSVQVTVTKSAEQPAEPSPQKSSA
jgi:CBS domain containing-hemolysin-like protein